MIRFLILGWDQIGPGPRIGPHLCRVVNYTRTKGPKARPIPDRVSRHDFIRVGWQQKTLTTWCPGRVRQPDRSHRFWRSGTARWADSGFRASDTPPSASNSERERDQYLLLRGSSLLCCCCRERERDHRPDGGALTGAYGGARVPARARARPPAASLPFSAPLLV